MNYEGPQGNPDAATIWALAALLDPVGESTEPSHTLCLPSGTLLHFFRPEATLHVGQPEHPLIVLPKLYREMRPGSLAFMTTLTLDGIDGVVTDQSVLALKYCSHLTALHMRGCRITDTPLHLLASALDLETKQGMCRLRAWYLPGCKGVTDKSMRSLSRYPALCVVDVRGTSVTGSGIDVLNRFQRTYFASENADYQPCTDGLLPLFSQDSAADRLDALCQSLLAGEAEGEGDGPREDVRPGGRWWLGLHVVPASHAVDPAWLPRKPVSAVPQASQSTSAAYFPGLGTIYTQNASSINMRYTSDGPDLERECDGGTDCGGSDDGESDVSWLGSDSSSGLSDPCSTDEERTVWDVPGFHNEELADMDRRGRRQERRVRRLLDAEQYKRDKQEFKEEEQPREALVTRYDRSRGFYTQRVGSFRQFNGQSEQWGTSDEDRKMMLVRMVSPDWDTLRWSTATKLAAAGDVAVRLKTSRTTKTQAGVTDTLLADIMGTRRERISGPAANSQSQSWAASPSLSYKTGASVLPSTPGPAIKARPRNPFKRTEPGSKLGIKPLVERDRVTPVPGKAVSRPVVGELKREPRLMGMGFTKKRRLEGKGDEGGARNSLNTFKAKPTGR